jgi:hypothetical protein
MIEIRELIIRTNVTKNASGVSQEPSTQGTKKSDSALEELMQGLHAKNER